MPTISQIVAAYPIAQYLAANDIQDKGLYGGGVNIPLPQKIRNIGDSVKRIFDNDPTDDSLQLTANYLWTLCGKYGLEALVIAGSASGGSVSPITPSSSLPLPIEFYVGASTLIPTNGNSVTINSFIGYNLMFNRGNVPQQQLNPGDGSNYFTWNRNTAQFFCFGNAQLGELFSLIPVG